MTIFLSRYSPGKVMVYSNSSRTNFSVYLGFFGYLFEMQRDGAVLKIS